MSVASGGTTARSEASVRHVLGRLDVQWLLLEQFAAVDEDGAPLPGPRGRPALTHVPERLAPPVLPAARQRAQAVEDAADRSEDAGEVLRLRRLARLFGLGEVDVEVLLLAAAPDIDPRHAQRYVHLQGGGDRVHLTPGLAMQFTGLHLANGPARARYGHAGPLVRAGLLRLEPAHLAYPQAVLRVPERVLTHLLGADVVDVGLSRLLVDTPTLPGRVADEVERAVRAGSRLVYLRDRSGGQGVGPAVAALERFGAAPVVVDLTRLSGGEDANELVDAAVLEARLRGVGLVAGPIDGLVAGHAELIVALAATDTVVVLGGRAAWDPALSPQVPHLVATERLTDDQRPQLWVQALGAELATTVDASGTTRQYRLSPDQLVRAASSARQRADAAGRALTPDDLRAGAQAQNDVALSRLARRIQPQARWEDLVLPAAVDAQVRNLATRWRHRDQVLVTWGLRRGTGQGRGVTALFSGDSGTGKTLSAEVLASELGLDLYVVELSTVIDKYIGETSKNLERIFDAADRVNGILLFDEADALFGKRSAVSDSRDRHANVEVAYLLQRMEAFDGIAILTTNLAANLDEAFLRRLDAIVDFPAPDVPQRRALWETLIPAALPRANDLNLGLLAERFRLSGSEIRNIITSAAYRAAEGGGPVTMTELVRATIREHRKAGRHLTAADLGEYEPLLSEGV